MKDHLPSFNLFLKILFIELAISQSIDQIEVLQFYRIKSCWCTIKQLMGRASNIPLLYYDKTQQSAKDKVETFAIHSAVNAE